MLQLQLKNLVVLKRSKKSSFFFIVSLFSFFAHIVAMIFACIVVRSDRAITIDTKVQDAPILFVPFLKEVKQIKGSTVPAASTKNNEVLKKEPPKVVQPKKLPIKKEEPKKIVQNKAASKPKTSVQPAKKNPVAKKVESKKIVPQQEKKIVEKKVQPLIKEKPQLKEVSKPVETTSVNNQAAQQEAVLVGMQDREIFILQDLLKKDIVAKWKRPTNIPEDALCQYRVKVYKNGTKEVILEKSSHALALDMSARNFLIQYDFPEHWADKDVSIIF